MLNSYFCINTDSSISIQKCIQWKTRVKSKHASVHLQPGEPSNSACTARSFTGIKQTIGETWQQSRMLDMPGVLDQLFFFLRQSSRPTDYCVSENALLPQMIALVTACHQVLQNPDNHQIILVRCVAVGKHINFEGQWTIRTRAMTHCLRQQLQITKTSGENPKHKLNVQT